MMRRLPAINKEKKNKASALLQPHVEGLKEGIGFMPIQPKEEASMA